ncbi:uncharacterized protein KZ484_006408 isoform 1-T2 [Pholidichthys leucotaenia]
MVESLSSRFILLILILHVNSSLAYSLKGCTINYPGNCSDDLFLSCSKHQLASVPDDIPRNAQVIDLNYNRINMIRREDFHNMSKLRILYLEKNYIGHVETGSFITLMMLEKLYMSNNSLINLAGNIFQGLSKLTFLDLSDNQIHFIHQETFLFLTSLQTLYLRENKLQRISDIQSILQLPRLQELSVRANSFSSFQSKDLLLNVSSALKILDVSYNEIKKFSISTPSFPHLDKLDLSECGRGSPMKWDIPDQTFLENITQLCISFHLTPFENVQEILQSLGSLTHLEVMRLKPELLSIVCKTPTLRQLHLSNSVLSHRTSNLVNCSRLSKLDLSANFITELTEGSIHLMRKLKVLHIEINSLNKVPYDIRGLSSLEVLVMDNNQISELGCEDFRNTTHLKELHLSFNLIARLDNCIFEHLSDLEFLDLSYNQLRTLGGAFELGLQSLEVLNLSRNAPSLVEGAEFRGLSSLKYLNLEFYYNPKMTPISFTALESLESLIVSPSIHENFMTLHHLQSLTIYISTEHHFKDFHPNIDEDVFQLKYLKVFTVIKKDSKHHVYSYFYLVMVKMLLQAMNHLQYFTAEKFFGSPPKPDTFQFNPKLKSLTLRKTDLSDLDHKLFHSIPNLQTLDLSWTQLRTLDFLMHANLHELRCLKLGDNQLTVINETVFQFLPALTYLDLDNNPFTCDCSNAGFIQWVKNNKKTQVVNAHQYMCSSPVSQQGTSLLDLNIQSCWMDIGFLCFISSTSLVLLTVLTSFIYHFLRWHLTYTFLLFRAFLYDTKKRRKGAACRYDAFISYNVHDEEWVYREMLPVLEGEQGWKLCLHHRDFQPGKAIIENITDAIYGCKKTICVISQRYLQSEWCSTEFQMASFRLFDEKKDVLILLFLEEIPARNLTPYYRMRKLVKRRTYLSWPQAGEHPGVFWENVRRALEMGDENTDLLTGPVGE